MAAGSDSNEMGFNEDSRTGPRAVGNARRRNGVPTSVRIPPSRPCKADSTGRPSSRQGVFACLMLKAKRPPRPQGYDALTCCILNSRALSKGTLSTSYQ
jgi:hypothetical protein